MDIIEVKNKIKKLLALSEDNPSDAEGYAAFQKAQELMAKYKLDKSDISEEEQKKCIRRTTTLHYGTRSSDHYLNELANIIANNFCCINYITTKRGYKTHYINFMGMEEDVDIAEEVIHTANAAIIRGYNKVYHDLCRQYHMDYMPAKYFNPAKTGYIDGYLDGLKDAFESQREKNQEWGLVLVAPQEAQDFLGGLNKKNFSRQVFVDRSYYNDGYNDGNNFHLNKKLNNSKTDGVLEGN